MKDGRLRARGEVLNEGLEVACKGETLNEGCEVACARRSFE